ncbi:hypothetical protein Tsubulata_017184 [Turnera subulata]|uniref:Desiccation-related protein PCC13-62 n=1 Tax=Turnera subulata TaxID=218843 RepID=A0A9Q0GJA5_9ROSI|nr:hypothetical protein Tsubulata_017184 [Turnera subulata]
MGIIPSLIFAFVFVITLFPANVLGDHHAAAPGPGPYCGPPEEDDRDLIQFAMNLEFFEAEYFLHGALGVGLDYFHPEYAMGGPPPYGAQKANLDPVTRKIIEEFGYQEIGHLRAIVQTVGGFPRPLYNLSREQFAQVFDQAVGHKLHPPFDPYANSVNYLLSCYVIPYMGLVGYEGMIPNLDYYHTKKLVGGLMGVEAGQDAVLRTMLYKIAFEKVEPYGITVADFTIGISKLRNELARCGIKDEGLFVPLELGAENRTESNILSADANSLTYGRLPSEIMRVVYGTGNESIPGGFLPEGGNGRIARSYLEKVY